MSVVLDAPARYRVGTGDDSDLAALVLVRDGCRRTWRDPRLNDDPDVEAWLRTALDTRHPHYASLFWSELEAIRSAR